MHLKRNGWFAVLLLTGNIMPTYSTVRLVMETNFDFFICAITNSGLFTFKQAAVNWKF
jgi:hypothetical protein